MSKIIQAKSPVLAVVTDSIRYLKARKEVEKLSQEHDLNVADMPMAIQAMANNPEIRKAVRPKYLDAITGEYHGQRDGEKSYETWHSVGSLSTVKGLEEAFKNRRGDYGFMTIDNNEWITVGDGKYLGQDVARVHLDDAKKGDVPTAGTPYTIFVRLDKDNPTIGESGQLSYDSFMADDRVLMLTGSPENRESVAKMLFGAEKDGGEGWSSVGSYHRMNDADFDTTARGRLVFLSYDGSGFGGNSDFSDNGRFLGVGDGVAQVGAGGTSHEKTTSQKIVQPTLEQTLAVINNPDLNREGMIKAVSTFYKQ
ncbi:hypothetical protein K9M74_03725 [Candidatus Woesearchaeota archaeon]|nr:hypothetical protein [Candidatus Woesearchaeota archaeon]